MMFLCQISWNPALPVAAVLALAAMLAAATAGLWRVLAARVGRRRAMPIAVARGAIFLLLLLAILDPVTRRVRAVRQARELVVLRDGSASMDVADGAGSRADRSRGLVERIRALSPSDVQVRECAFDSHLRAGDEARRTAAASEPPGTDVAGALSELAARETPETAAIVLLTDGGDEPIQPTHLPRAPLLAVGIGGDGSRGPNIGFAAVEVPETVEKDARFNVQADLAATGPAAFLAKLGQVGVTLSRQEGNRWVEIARQLVDLRQGRCRVGFPASCGDPGTVVYRLVAESAAGEQSVLDNRRTVRVDVRRKALNVLYYSRRLGADLKMLRQELGVDPGLTFSALFRSTGERFTVQEPPEGVTVLSEQELAAGFPVDPEKLRRFDCVIVGSFPAYEWSAAEMRALLGFVEQGGGVVLLGGDDSFDGGGYGDSPLKPLLPWSCSGGGSSLQREVGLVSVPAAAEQEPAVAGLGELLSIGGTNRQPIALTVSSVNVPGEPLPAAQVLLEVSRAGRLVPLALQHRYGKGRILTVASNTTWHWARDTGSGAQFYRRFWRQAVRASCGQFEGGRLLQVSWNRTVYRPGDRVIARVRCPGVADVQVRAALNGSDSTHPLAVAPAEAGVWQVEWLLEQRGLWTLQLTASRGAETLEVYSKTLTVAPLPDEGSRLGRQDAELQRLAASARGAYLPEEQAGEKLEDALKPLLRPVTRTESRALISDGPWFALLAATAVLLELTLRRRLNLL